MCHSSYISKDNSAGIKNKNKDTISALKLRTWTRMQYGCITLLLCSADDAECGSVFSPLVVWFYSHAILWGPNTDTPEMMHRNHSKK